MAIKNACFISYSHGQYEYTKKFMEDLKKAIQNELDAYLNQPIYVDEERLKPGYNWDVSLTRAICESVCMIVVYTPKYDESDYCITEFCAMEKIERERITKLGESYDNKYRMIIPIILRRPKILPEKIKKIQHINDFSKYTLYSTEITMSPDFEPIIRQIVEVIYEIYCMLKQDPDLFEHENCTNFTAPSLDEIQNSWGKFKEKPKFPPKFPGRI